MSVMNGDPPGKGRKKPSEPAGITYGPIVDHNPEAILGAEEIAEIRAQARLKAQNELKDRAAKQLLDQYTKEERQKLLPEEQVSEIWLDLAPHSPYIMLDGKQYLPQTRYYVTRSVWSVLVEQMNRGWAHDEQTQVTDAKGRRRYRPPMGIGFDNFAARVGPWGDDRNLKMGSPEDARLRSTAL